MDAAIAALIGAAVGAVPGVLAPLWTQRAESRRARLKLAVELGKADFEFFKDQVAQKPGGGPVPPVSLYVTYHAEFLAALEHENFGPEAAKEIEKKLADLHAALPRRF